MCWAHFLKQDVFSVLDIIASVLDQIKFISINMPWEPLTEWALLGSDFDELSSLCQYLVSKYKQITRLHAAVIISWPIAQYSIVVHSMFSMFWVLNGTEQISALVKFDHKIPIWICIFCCCCKYVHITWDFFYNCFADMFGLSNCVIWWLNLYT